MLFALVVCGLVVGSVGDHDHETEKVGNCRDNCYDVCVDGDKYPGDERLCSAFNVNEDNIVVDPWMCGEPRCQQVECGDCGDQDYCVEQCEEFKEANEIEGYPANCNSVCNKQTADYKCWQRCTRFDDVFVAPACDNYVCSEALCTAPGKQDCSAAHNLVDPLNCLRNSKCKDIQCSWCGNHQDCQDHCERYNRNNGADLDCGTECQVVDGYKCWVDC